MTDVFRPHNEPARTIYDAFQEESKSVKAGLSTNGLPSSVKLYGERHAITHSSTGYECRR